MHTITEFLGFTSPASTLWNAISYLAFLVIIIGVFWERYRNWFVTLGGAALGIYAAAFLQNTVLTTLQAIITISGILQLLKTSRPRAIAIMTALSALAYLYLIASNSIANMWAFIGSLGLLGIAFGLIILPKRCGFLVMAAGGLLLVGYAFAVSAWVFFFLNIFFFAANLHTWKSAR